MGVMRNFIFDQLRAGKIKKFGITDQASLLIS